MVLVAEADEPAAQQLRRELAVRGRDVHQLGPDDTLDRAALVDVDVRSLSADHRLEGTQHGRECSDVAAGPVEHGEGLRPAEHLPQPVAKALRPLIVSVGARPSFVGGDNRREHLRMRPGVVVAGEQRERLSCDAHAATFFLSCSKNRLRGNSSSSTRSIHTRGSPSSLTTRASRRHCDPRLGVTYLATRSWAAIQ